MPGRATFGTALLAAAALLGAPGCGSLVVETDSIIIERQPERAYEVLFPYYVEICAVSQFRSKSKGFGGVPGHAVMYVKGACVDESSPYPQLRRCRRAATELDDPEHGAGVSVNRWFRNVNWVATPGKALFFDGDLESGERLTREHFDATVRSAIERGVYRGVELHDYPTEAEERSLEDFVMRHSAATDIAMRFARSVFCARLPVEAAMLDEIIDFLNAKNRSYATGEADYEWSGFSDNCVHTLRNALAAASVWEPLSVQAIKIRQFFNLAIPANEFVNLALLGTEGSLAVDDVLETSVHRDALMEFDWLPTRHGALVKTRPVHANNDLYDTTLRLFVLQSPLRRSQTRAGARLLADERFVDLEKDLRHFASIYDEILAGRDAEENVFASLQGEKDRRARRRYYDYIESQRAEVESMLERLPALREGAR